MNTPADPQPQVHLVDDEAAVRDALEFLLRSHGMPVCCHADGPALLQQLDSQRLRGCLLLDVRMEPMSGLQLHDELRQRGCRLPVLFLSGHGDIPMAVDALQKGALDFIEKPFDADQLTAKLQRALALEAEQHLHHQRLQQIRDHLASLTAREHEVMRRVAAGKLNKVIADELEIAVRTVEVHRARVLAKLEVRSATELATLLARLGEGG